MEIEIPSVDTTVDHTFYTPPPVVGGYRMGKQTTGYTQFNLSYKPNWFHRQMMKLCFGWYWFDEK